MTVMARTVRTLVMYYRCCCVVMAVLQLQVPGMTAAAAVIGGDGGLERPVLVAVGGSGRGTVTAVFAGAADGAAVPARNKRWSTTFGANSSNKNATTNNVVRDCNTDSDCLETPYTSCALDPSDRKRRCLCADGKQPLNGDCLKKPRALRMSCETDVECLPNAVCKNNATLTNPRLKTCLCKDGFTEENETCNYSDLLTSNYATLLIAVFTSWIWNDRRA